MARLFGQMWLFSTLERGVCEVVYGISAASVYFVVLCRVDRGLYSDC